MALVERVCVDRWEAHLVVARTGARHPHNERPRGGDRYVARSEAGVFPQAYVTRDEAAGACAAAGKRLCTRAEWRRACGGRAGTTYPYGPRRVAGRCNDGKPHLLTLRYGADPRRWRYDAFNDPSLGLAPGFLARTGASEGCVSDEGVLDLVGNLHEWVSDTADTDFRARLDRDGVRRSFQYWSPGNAVFVGGFYSTVGELGPGCTFTTIAHEPSYHDYATGFRCCADRAR